MTDIGDDSRGDDAAADGSGDVDHREPLDVEYPEFDHGDTLALRWRQDGTLEFRGDGPDETIRATNVVRLDRQR